TNGGVALLREIKDAKTKLWQLTTQLNFSV
ncbi:MAG: hypothetical protein ACI8QD_002779, partial [Cyclobacteriaceae bacterium]